MKGVFLGEYELNVLGKEDILAFLNEYGFSTVYVHEGVIHEFDELFEDFTVLVWVEFGNKTVDELVGVYDSCSGFVDGLCFDYVRCDEPRVCNIPRVFNIYEKVKKVIETINVPSNEYHACLKCEVYSNVWLNEVQRLMYGQSITLLKKICNKLLLMNYHTAYNTTIKKITQLIKKLQKIHGEKVTPIWGVYQDKPAVDYNKYYPKIITASQKFENNTYFRLGTCDPRTFSKHL